MPGGRLELSCICLTSVEILVQGFPIRYGEIVML
jgi:hypothetical protein